MQFGCSASGAQQHPSVAAVVLEHAAGGTTHPPKMEDAAASQPFCLHPQPKKPRMSRWRLVFKGPFHPDMKN